MVFETLAYNDLWANDTRLPWLATDWDMAEDDLTFTIYLREGVKFSDGSDFDAEDVAASFYLTGGFFDRDRLSDVIVVDDYTVVIVFQKRGQAAINWALTRKMISYDQYGEYSDAIWELIQTGGTEENVTEVYTQMETDLSTPDFDPIGTGPYKVKSYTASEIVLEKWDGYWREAMGLNQVYIDKVRQLRAPSDAMMMSLFMTGQLDWADTVPASPDVYQALKLQPYTRLVSIPNGHGVALFFGCDVYPWNITEVRQAIAYAIDRDMFTAVTETLVPDFATPIPYSSSCMESVLPLWLSEDFLAERMNKYEHNPAMSIALLEGLGWTRDPVDGVWVTDNGTRLEVELYGSGAAKRCGLRTESAFALGAENIALQLETIGIKVTPKVWDTATAWQNFKSGLYDMCLYGWWNVFTWGPPTASPIMWAGSLYSWLLVGYDGGGPGFGPIVEDPIYGTIDLTEKYQELADIGAKEDQLPLIEMFEYVQNYYLPELHLTEQRASHYVHEERITGWPIDPEDPFWLAYLGGHWGRFPAYALASGMLKPRGVVPIGPTEPPIEVTELTEKIDSLAAQVTDLTSTVGELTTEMATVEGQVGQFNTLLIASVVEGILVILLVAYLATRRS
jgi:peptide/nickel transport system substrate-binding protein